MRKICYMLAGLVLTACGEAEKSRVLVVSVEPQRALLEEIAGDRFEVVTLLTPGANPETYEPGMGVRRSLETAAAYFTTGYLPFEERLGESLPDRVDMVDTSVGIIPVTGTHEHGHGHHHHGHHGHHAHGADPHVWTSAKNARIMAANIYDYLVRIDPEGKPYYEPRYRRLTERIDSLDAAFGRRLASPGASRSFAIWHPSLSYLARDYGLEQIAVGFENKEMPAATLRRVIDEARRDSVKVFFFQKEFDSRQARTLNDELGTRLVTINPLAYEWEQQLDSIVSELCR